MKKLGMIGSNNTLVGGWATPLKNMKVNWDDDIPNISGKIKLMATKPPTSNVWGGLTSNAEGFLPRIISDRTGCLFFTGSAAVP